MKKIKNQLIGLFILFIGILNVILTGTILTLAAPLKLINNKRIKKFIKVFTEEVTQQWVRNNLILFEIFLDTKWHIDCPKDIQKNGQYLIISNHQTWVDIFVILKTFVKNAPYIRFFMKEQLKFLPIVGTSCMILDYPFMKRYSKEFLEKNPHLSGKDLETTRRSCEKLKGSPVAILNFAEGTRFTEKKHDVQHSPYKHLLKPKSGGIAYSLAAFSGEIKQVVDVTIIYPNGTKPSLVDFLCNQVPEITVKVTVQAPPKDAHIKDYQTDNLYKHEFQHWMAKIWHDKDIMIDTVLKERQ